MDTITYRLLTRAWYLCMFGCIAFLQSLHMGFKMTLYDNIAFCCIGMYSCFYPAAICIYDCFTARNYTKKIKGRR